MLEAATGSSLLWPAILAVGGFILKSIYDAILDYRKRKRKLIETKLQNFYWPICIRIKKNQNFFNYFFEGKEVKDKESVAYKVTHYVEENILIKNHDEIVDIITKYRYLADPDNEIDGLIDQYLRHVSIYKAFLNSKIDEYPDKGGNAPYPARIDDYFFDKTKELQRKLDKQKI